jgi:hypothetical protein
VKVTDSKGQNVTNNCSNSVEVTDYSIDLSCNINQDGIDNVYVNKNVLFESIVSTNYPHLNGDIIYKWYDRTGGQNKLISSAQNAKTIFTTLGNKKVVLEVYDKNKTNLGTKTCIKEFKVILGTLEVQEK